MNTIRILIVTRHISFREALRIYLTGMDPVEEVRTAAGPGDAIGEVGEFAPHLLIVDGDSEDLHMLEKSFQAWKITLSMKSIVYTIHDTALIKGGKGKWADECLAQEDLFKELPRIINDLFR